MTLEVRLFAILRERAGSDQVRIELPGGATVADALSLLGAMPALAELIERLPMRLAVNRDYATPETVLVDGDELALIPPLSGGADADVHVRLTDQPLSLEALTRAVGRPRAGAIVAFQGVTREVSALHYEAYADMALARMGDIARRCLDEHGLQAIAIEHRIGRVALGEPSVIVAVAAAHRAEAFAAARQAIDLLKEDVPIWKREIEADGSARWIH